MNYGKPEHFGAGSQADVDTTELDLFEVTDGSLLTDSQLTAFINVIALGTHTKIEFRYYARYTIGGDWYELPYRNDGTGELSSVPSFIGSATKLVDSLALPACMAFKMTAKGVGGANGNVAVSVMSRDN